MKTITKFFLALITMMLIGTVLMAQYCVPPGFKDMGGVGEPFTFISNVELGDLKNPTGMPTGVGDDDGYMYYETLDAPRLVPGFKHTLKVTANDNISSGMNVVVWIDYNNDEKFDGPGERIMNTGGAGDHVLDFTVPDDAVHGVTRMRVYCDMPPGMGHLAPEPCGYLNYPSHEIGQHGEVEDYDVQIGNPTGIQSVSSERSISIYPNPVRNILNVNHNMDGTVNYAVYDVFGKEITRGVFISGNEELDVSGYSNGQYILRFQNNSDLRTATFNVLH